MLICELFSQNKSQIILRNSQANLAIRRNAEIKLAKTSAVIIGVYFICWSPTLIKFYLALFTNINTWKPWDWIAPIIRDFSNLAAHFNSALNPIIYAYRISWIRNGIKKILQRDQCVDAEISDDQRIPEPSDQEV